LFGKAAQGYCVVDEASVEEATDVSGGEVGGVELAAR
jgi:hypothetical protein